MYFTPLKMVVWVENIKKCTILPYFYTFPHDFRLRIVNIIFGSFSCGCDECGDE